MSVICLGEALIDLLANQAGVTLAQVTDWTPYPGGAPTNVACGLVKLGTPTTLISCLGQDDVGTEFTQLLTEIGVDLTGLQYHPTAPTRQIYVTRSIDGDRSFAGFIDNLATDRFADTYLTADRIPESLFTQAKFLAIGTISLATPISYAATYKALELARKNRVLVLVDVNWRDKFWDDIDRARSVILKVLTQADLVKMAKEEAEWLFDLPASQSLSEIDLHVIQQQLPNAQGIFLTDGSEGCKYLLNNLTGFVPAFKVPAIDTTGAGDSFVSALIHQLSQQDITTIQDNEEIDNIVKYASAAGAITTLKAGAIDAQPNNVEVVKFLIDSINPIS
jgi:fructokinase